MSIWHLLWIIPLSAGLGLFAAALAAAAGNADK